MRKRNRMNETTAQQFTQEWIKSWNAHDPDQIISHYADDVEFHSPFIKLLNYNDEGVIRSKNELKAYFEIGLNKYPDLHFELHHCYTGINTLVIHYTSVNGLFAAEVFELNENGKAIRVYCHYTNPN